MENYGWISSRKPNWSPGCFVWCSLQALTKDSSTPPLLQLYSASTTALLHLYYSFILPSLSESRKGHGIRSSTGGGTLHAPFLSCWRKGASEAVPAIRDLPATQLTSGVVFPRCHSNAAASHSRLLTPA